MDENENIYKIYTFYGFCKNCKNWVFEILNNKQREHENDNNIHIH